ncbi:MAG: hypothetical protein HUJ76_12205, partial [Parasporobacterium sp.]|nr:hypothetical protein [Parasporobacterium sp.]
MKKEIIRKITCLVLTMVVAMTMTGTGVFATELNTDQPADQQDVNAQEETAEVEQSAADEEEPIEDESEPDVEIEGTAGDVTVVSKTYNSTTKAYDVVISSAATITIKKTGTPDTVTWTKDGTNYSASLPVGYIYDVIVNGETKAQILSTKVGISATKGNATVAWDKVENLPSGKMITVTSVVAKPDAAPIETLEATVDGSQVKSDDPKKSYVSAKMVTGWSTKYRVEVQDVADKCESGALTSASKITDFKVLRDYEGVTLKWTRSGNSNIKEFAIYRDGSIKKRVTNSPSKSSYSCYLSGIDPGDKCSYKVVGVFENGTKGTASSTKKQRAVMQLTVHVYTKTAKTLYSHDGDNAKLTLPSGKHVVTDGFGSGKYKFHMNGHLFYLNRTSTKGAHCDYDKTHDESNYTIEE